MSSKNSSASSRRNSTSKPAAAKPAAVSTVVPPAKAADADAAKVAPKTAKVKAKVQQAHPVVVLASTSPRRVELLRQANLSVVTRAPQADETPGRNEPPRALVQRLCRTKAESVAEAATAEFGSGVIIAADTIVVSPDGTKILNKPKDAKDARRMLRMLSGNTHTVLTGYCIQGFGMTSEKRSVNQVVKTRVTMRKLSNAEIERYIRTGEPMDKAGAYAAQGLGMCFIESISGSYTNVVGLPISQLLDDLDDEFGITIEI